MPGIQIVIDSADAARLVQFWSLVLDYVPSLPPEGFDTWNDWYRSVGVPEEELDLTRDAIDRLMDPAQVGPPIWFQPVPEGKTVKNRVHLDVYSAGTSGAWSYRTRSGASGSAPRPTS